MTLDRAALQPTDDVGEHRHAAAILDGDRRALARAITLIESTRTDHRAQAESLLAELLPTTGRSIRIGISGVPGVGKSTFIEAFGLHIVARGHRVAVITVDPSSPISGGSILGDKTRMEKLSRHPSTYIRPSPSGGSLGGVARRTREVILATEAAGFDVILVETVGVGQSETAVAGLVDMFMLLIAPGGGDELQGLKKGIVELAELIVVNKADGDLIPAAERARRDYSAALHLLRHGSEGWTPKVLKCSSMTGEAIDEVWETAEAFRTAMSASGKLEARRAEQAKAWMWDEVNEALARRLKEDAAVGALLPELEARVQAGSVNPADAARQVLAAFGCKDE